MRFVTAVALAVLAILYALAPADAAPISFHAASLSPTLSLLSWSAPSSSRWLSLSLDPHSTSQLSLPVPPDAPSHLIISGALDGTDAASAAFTLCEHDSDQRDGSPSSYPLCAHVTLSALHSSASAAATVGSAEPRWDLDGARLSAELTRSPVDPSSHRISWSAARVSSDPAAPPLLYSMFAEWSAHTIDAKQLRSATDTAATDSATAASLQPTLQRHSVRMCSVRSDKQQSQEQLHCDVSADRLPRGVELTLHLFTECDYHTIGAEGAAMMPHCLSAVSPELRVSLPLQPIPSALALQQVLFEGASDVRQAGNDPLVQAALCDLFSLTAGIQWTYHAGWCNSAVPICGNATSAGWFGVGCDQAGEVISLRLANNDLASVFSPDGLDLSPTLAFLPHLRLFDVSENPALMLSRLDLSPLSNLSSLALSGLPSRNVGSQSLILPAPNCLLDSMDIQSTSFAVQGWSNCATTLTHLDISSTRTPIPFAVITLLPALVQLTADSAALTGDAIDGIRGLRGGELTLFILAHLNDTNPRLQSMDLSNCASLPFGLSNATDNFPSIRSDSLSDLTLDGLALRTGPMGPANDRWLEGMPSLSQLSLRGLSSAVVHTAAFAFASPTLQVLSCDCTIVGDLFPLQSLQSLSSLSLSASGLRSQLPANLSAVWPYLSVIECSGCNLFGQLPGFRHLPYLQEVILDRNALVGVLGVDWAKESHPLFTVVLSGNLLTGPLPSFCNSPSIRVVNFAANRIAAFPSLSCYSTVQVLQLQSNPSLRGELPRDLWQRLPSIMSLLISNTMMNGTIPDRDPSSSAMFQFLASGCGFTSRLPLNINSQILDLSDNQLCGPLVLFDERFTGTPSIQSLRLASAGRLTCPIELSLFSNLGELILSNNGFDGCSWTNVTLPPNIEQLDISSNAFLPFFLSIPAWAVSVKAANANIRGVLTDALSLPMLSELVLDGSAFAPLNSEGVSVSSQLTWLLMANGACSILRSFSCQFCSLDLALSAVLHMLGPNSLITHLRLDSSGLYGEFPAAIGDTFQTPFPIHIQQFSVANNPLLSGHLFSTDFVFEDLQLIDVSGCRGLVSAIPASWWNLPALTQLNLANSSIQCELVVNVNFELKCVSPAVLAASQTVDIASASLADTDAGVHCSALTIAATGSSGVTADPSYHSYTECRCDANSFGLNALCYRCPEGCTCSEDRIQNCFPVVQRGAISVNPADSSGSRSVIAGSIAPFTVTTVLPCPRTITGSSLCNPDGIAWPSFYRIVETAEAGSVSVALTDSDASSPSDSEIDLSDWCYPGHTGRLCAACSSGYFSSGRWCLQCLSEGVHALILVANLLLIVALIAYLYVKSPGAVNAARGLRLYLTRMARFSAGLSVVSHSRSMQELQSAEPARPDFVLPSSPSAGAADMNEAANPLKLLIFHSQQLSLLLHTSTSLPVVMTGLLSFMSSGSTGFSLSSLVAMECLSSWTLRERCWMAVVAPALIGLVAGLIALFGRTRGSAFHGGRAMQLQGREEPLLPGDSEPDVSPSSSSIVPRIYSVWVSLLYFMFFPCAQTVLSAVACTDTRESDRLYLNLFPAAACDDEWRRTILPPAVLGLMFWIVAFPLGSTMMLFKLRSRLAASSGSDSSSVLSMWPVCSDLLLPYSPRFWFWDQLLLLRRLLLVTAVTIIPSSSLYLPLVLFAIIQLSALQQHWAHPYAHPLLNAGELASLYLLLINYISAIILQTGLSEGGFHQTANGWAAALFVVNLAFLLILVAGLFGWARQWIAARLTARKQQQRL